LEASGGSLLTRGRSSRCDREGMGGLRQDWLEAPHGALLSTRRTPIAQRGKGGASSRAQRTHRDGPGATARCRLAGSTTRPADLGKRPKPAVARDVWTVCNAESSRRFTALTSCGAPHSLAPLYLREQVVQLLGSGRQ
jgi:hypothetical protein